LTSPPIETSVDPESWKRIPLFEETLLLAAEGMVTLTALKWTGVSPTIGNLVEATTVRAGAGAAGAVSPAAWVASAAAQNTKLPIVMDRMSLSRTKVHLQQKQDLIGEKIGAAHYGLVYARTLHSQIPHSVLPRADEVIQ